MQKIRKRTNKLSLRRETLRKLDEQQLDRVAGGFTGDCTPFPSHGQCSNPCTLSCAP
jgi:natural product precursor